MKGYEDQIITRTIKRYFCYYCSNGYLSKKAVINHLKKCWYNPNNKTCKTCEFAVDDYNSQSFITKCSLKQLPKYNATDKSPDININCEQWKKFEKNII